jgi:hypothetical protein
MLKTLGVGVLLGLAIMFGLVLCIIPGTAVSIGSDFDGIVGSSFLAGVQDEKKSKHNNKN